MDMRQIQEMAGHGFQLGLHGHQHVAEVTTQYVHLAESQAMAVVSAGSLCAGGRDLPRGIDRQYNLIVVEEDYLSARVHVREMTDGGHFTRKADRGFAQGYVEVGWQAPVDAAGREIDADIENERRVTIKAEEALHAGDPGAALSALDGLPFEPGSYARRLALEAARRAEDWPRIEAIVSDPHGTEETVLLVAALDKLGRFDKAEEVLAGRFDLDPGIRRELRDRLSIRRAMEGV
jgi:hypothetical protein